MKKMLLPLLIFFVSCGEQTIEQGIKGHTFARENKVSLIRISFKRDMSVVYKWKNGWEKKPNSRDDLSYVITSDTSFQVFTDTMSVWGNGVYISQRRPYILLDNFKGDTLYLKY